MLIKEIISLTEIKYSDTLDSKYNNLPENVKTAIIKLDNLAKNIYKKYSASGNINRDIAEYVAGAFDKDEDTFKDQLYVEWRSMEDHFHLNYDPNSRFNDDFKGEAREIFGEMFSDGECGF